MTFIPTRGERNNNPGNLRFNMHTNWLGQVGNDDGYCMFDTPEHGVRALCKVLLNYQRLDQLKTLRQMISRWAPSAENDTDAYIADVADRLGLDPDQPFDVESLSELSVLARAIILHENGRCMVDADTVTEAAKDALAS